jgi:hypothetical protein
MQRMAINAVKGKRSLEGLPSGVIAGKASWEIALGNFN